MRIIACYPRTMSAWLANLLTIPHQSLYAHDALHQPHRLDRILRVDRPYVGIVDTGASLPGALDKVDVDRLTVIDADTDKVKRRCSHLFSRDMTQEVEWLERGMERLKGEADAVFHADDWSDWIGEVYYTHTGCAMDWARYEALGDLNVQSQFARSIRR